MNSLTDEEEEFESLFLKDLPTSLPSNPRHESPDLKNEERVRCSNVDDCRIPSPHRSALQQSTASSIDKSFSTDYFRQIIDHFDQNFHIVFSPKSTQKESNFTKVLTARYRKKESNCNDVKACFLDNCVFKF